MPLTRAEQETVIRWDEESDEATVWTSSPIVYRRLIKRGFKVEVIDDCSWVVKVAKKKIRLPSNAATRVLTEEQRLKASVRMKTMIRGRK